MSDADKLKQDEDVLDKFFAKKMEGFATFKMVPLDAPVIEQLASALKDARDHLEYCGYGDSWERECAKANGLSEKIEKAIREFEALKEDEL